MAAYMRMEDHGVEEDESEDKDQIESEKITALTFAQGGGLTAAAKANATLTTSSVTPCTGWKALFSNLMGSVWKRSPLRFPSRNACIEPEPLYFVRNVFKGSPVESAGLKAGDVILEFGSMTVVNESARVLRDNLKQHLNREMPLRIKRTGVGHITLKVIPQIWSGQGLLGCYLEPISTCTCRLKPNVTKEVAPLLFSIDLTPGF